MFRTFFSNPGITWYLPVAAVLLLTGCEDKSLSTAPDVFFNTEKYFSSEVVRLGNENYHVSKIIHRNGLVDSANPVNLNWKMELEPFMVCNINKPSMRTSYSIDTVSEEKMKRISYQALEARLTVRKVEVLFAGDRVVRLAFEQQETNELYRTLRRLVYAPDSGFSINGSQEMTMGEKTDYGIKVLWK